MTTNISVDSEGIKPVAVVTGALTGIGRATALAFGKSGYRVVIAGRKEEVGKAFLTELHGLGIEAEFVRTDVRNEEDVIRMVDAAIACFGRLDAAVNSAAYQGKGGPVSEQTPEEFKDVFDTNVLGTLLSMKHEMRVMRKQGFGSIVNLSSSMGIRGAPNASLYTGSKHAVEGITKSVALEAAPFGIRVNAVAPGPTDTELLGRFVKNDAAMAAMIQGVPMKRLGTPEEVANMIVFVASDAVPFMTGEFVRVNGGKTA